MYKLIGDSMYNDIVYEKVKSELINTRYIKIDVNDKEFKEIIIFATEGDDYEFLLTKDGLEYWNPRYLDFYEIIDGKWNDEKIYFWYDKFADFCDEIHGFYNDSLKAYFIDNEL